MRQFGPFPEYTSEPRVSRFACGMARIRIEICSDAAKPPSLVPKSLTILPRVWWIRIWLHICPQCQEQLRHTNHASHTGQYCKLVYGLLLRLIWICYIRRHSLRGPDSIRNLVYRRALDSGYWNGALWSQWYISLNTRGWSI